MFGPPRSSCPCPVLVFAWVCLLSHGVARECQDAAFAAPEAQRTHGTSGSVWRRRAALGTAGPGSAGPGPMALRGLGRAGRSAWGGGPDGPALRL